MSRPSRGWKKDGNDAISYHRPMYRATSSPHTHSSTNDDDEHEHEQRLTLGSDPRASMAMSDTGSSFAQWAALYHHHHHDAGPVLLPPDDDAGTTAAAAAVASPTSGGSSGGSPTKAGAHLLHGVEGPRIGKPAARRRSRASRRAPVTLLNTDTANFRAMVQQFTGIPAPPAGAFGAPVINFAADYGFPPSSAAVMSFDHQLHRSQHPAPLQEQLRRQQQQQQYAGAASPFGYSNGGGGGLLQDGGDVFAPAASHGFAASAEERMFLQSIQAAQMPHMPAANTSTNGFFA